MPERSSSAPRSPTLASGGTGSITSSAPSGGAEVSSSTSPLGGAGSSGSTSQPANATAGEN